MHELTAIVVGLLFGAVLGWIFMGATGGGLAPSIDVTVTFGGTGAISALGYHVVATKYLCRWLSREKRQ